MKFTTSHPHLTVLRGMSESWHQLRQLGLPRKDLRRRNCGIDGALESRVVQNKDIDILPGTSEGYNWHRTPFKFPLKPLLYSLIDLFVPADWRAMVIPASFGIPCNGYINPINGGMTTAPY